MKPALSAKLPEFDLSSLDWISVSAHKQLQPNYDSF